MKVTKLVVYIIAFYNKVNGHFYQYVEFKSTLNNCFFRIKIVLYGKLSDIKRVYRLAIRYQNEYKHEINSFIYLSQCFRKVVPYFKWMNPKIILKDIPFIS